MMGRSHDEYMVEVFRDDPAFAAFMVNTSLEKNDDEDELKWIMRYIAEAGLRVSCAPAEAQKVKPKRAKRAKAAPKAKRVGSSPGRSGLPMAAAGA